VADLIGTQNLRHNGSVDPAQPSTRHLLFITVRASPVAHAGV
jgi:hypothetical protein